MKVSIKLFQFGKADAPLIVNEDGSMCSSTTFTGEDIADLLESLHGQYSSGPWGKPKRTQRQKDIAELSMKLKRLIAKERHIEGILWAPYKKKNQESFKAIQTPD